MNDYEILGLTEPATLQTPSVDQNGIAGRMILGILLTVLVLAVIVSYKGMKSELEENRKTR